MPEDQFIFSSSWLPEVRTTDPGRLHYQGRGYDCKQRSIFKYQTDQRRSPDSEIYYLIFETNGKCAVGYYEILLWYGRLRILLVVLNVKWLC